MKLSKLMNSRLNAAVSSSSFTTTETNPDSAPADDYATPQVSYPHTSALVRLESKRTGKIIVFERACHPLNFGSRGASSVGDISPS